MNVWIKNPSIEMQIKTCGMELEIREPGGDHFGELVITKTKVIWRKRGIRRENAVALTWERFATHMEEQA